ncbi:MAG: hypothetical protein ACK4GT_06370 [Pararhodobacter sp.]
MAKGQEVTVAKAAVHAGVSTATAYRYYSHPETLRLEAGLELDMGPNGDFLAILDARIDGVVSIPRRVIAAHQIMVEFVRRNEMEYRLFIAKGHEQVVLDHKPQKSSPRGRRRIPMMQRAVEPVQELLGPERTKDLVRALMAASGPEPYFVLTDVGQLPDEDIDRVTEQNLSDIVHAHLTRAGVTGAEWLA